MKRANRALYAGVGAVTGGGVAGLLAVLMFGPDSRFLFEGARDLGIAGALGGMLCGLLLGTSARSAAVAAIAGIGGGGVSCVLVLVVVVLYAAIPWPSPRPYPGCDPEVEIGGGSAMRARVEEYTVSLSLEEVEEYYRRQMPWYCVDEWRFVVADSCNAMSCTEASCSIRRLWRAQYFRVILASTSDQRTEVTHIDVWED